MPTPRHSYKTRFYPFFFFLKSAFKSESKSYLPIWFRKGCIRHGLSTTVGDSVEGIDKGASHVWMMSLCRTVWPHPAVCANTPRVRYRQLWTEARRGWELTPCTSLRGCFQEELGKPGCPEIGSDLKDKCVPSPESEGTGPDIQTGTCIVQGVSLWWEATNPAMPPPQRVPCDFGKQPPGVVGKRLCRVTSLGYCLLHLPSGLRESDVQLASK